MKPHAAQSSTLNSLATNAWSMGQSYELPAPVTTQRPDVSYLFDQQLSRISQALQELEAQTRIGEETERELSSLVAQLLNDVPREVPVPAVPEDYEFALHLVGFPNTPLYIKRQFEVTFKIVSKNGADASAVFPLCCVLSVRKMDAENTEITEARSGKPFLRGQLVQVFAQGPVMTFHNLVFTDISSLFPHGRVNLSVQCVNQQRFKQLLVEGVRVKARKKHPNEVM